MTDSFITYSTASTGVPKYSSFASLPSALSAVDGDMAVTTDTDTLYVFNGVSWVVVGVGGSTVVAVTDTATVDLTNTSGNLSADIVAGSITNALVSPTAAIDASKIADGSVSNAEFRRLDGVTSGIQGQIDGKVAKAGDSMTGNLTFAGGFGIESTSAASTLNVGTTSNTDTLNLGTGAHTNTVNIATGAGITTINIGGSGDTVAIAGTLATVNTTNLDVTDKLITVNKGGLASSGFISGISIEEGGSEVGYIRTNATRDGIELKAPAAAGNFDFRPGSVDTFIISNAAASAKTITIPNVTGTLITTGDTGTVTSTMIANDTIVNDDISPTAAISLSKLATGALPTGITVDTANIIADSVTLDKLGAGALPTDITVASANIVDETITNNDISPTAAIARSKLASGTANHVVINDGSGVMTSEAALSPTRGGTGQTSVTTGDILYSSASNVISKLPIGTSGQLLTVSGGVPTWQTGLSDPMTTAGDMLIRDGSNATARLPVGAANTVLTSNGTVPTYAQVTSAMIADGTIVNADISGSAAIDGSKIQSASASNAGVVTTGTQTFAGEKTFQVSSTQSFNLENTNSTAMPIQFIYRNFGGPGVRSSTLQGESAPGDVNRLRTPDLFYVSNSTASTSTTTGALVVDGGVGVGENLHVQGSINNRSGTLELGAARTSPGPAYVDFISETGNPDFNGRLIRNTGANGTLQLLQTGSGSIDIDVTAAGGTGGINLISAGGASVLINRAGTNHIAVDGNGTAVRGRIAGVTAGYVGETKISQLASDFTIPTGGYVQATGVSVTLEAGIWMISGTGYTINNNTGQQVWWSIHTIAGDNAPLMVYKYYQPNEAYIAGIGPFVVAHNSTQVYNFYVQCSNASINLGLKAGYTQIRAVRIA